MQQKASVIIGQPPQDSILGPSLLKKPTELGEDKWLLIRSYGKTHCKGLGGVSHHKLHSRPE